MIARLLHVGRPGAADRPRPARRSSCLFADVEFAPRGPEHARGRRGARRAHRRRAASAASGRRRGVRERPRLGRGAGARRGRVASSRAVNVSAPDVPRRRARRRGRAALVAAAPAARRGAGGRRRSAAAEVDGRPTAGGRSSSSATCAGRRPARRARARRAGCCSTSSRSASPGAPRPRRSWPPPTPRRSTPATRPPRCSTAGALGAVGAAWCNGVLANVLDYDDGHRLTKGHPGAVVIPAALAAAQAWTRRPRRSWSPS